MSQRWVRRLIVGLSKRVEPDILYGRQGVAQYSIHLLKETHTYVEETKAELLAGPGLAVDSICSLGSDLVVKFHGITTREDFDTNDGWFLVIWLTSPRSSGKNPNGAASMILKRDMS